MGGRYLVLAPANPVSLEDLRELAGKTGLPVRLGTHRLIVLAADEDAVLFSDGSGALIGTIFDREGQPTAVHGIDMAITSAMRADVRRTLDHFWGAYVVAQMSLPDAAVEIARDPSGMLPCLAASWRGGTVFASDLRTLASIGIDIQTIDWSAMADELGCGDLRGSDTALAHVRELLPGRSVCLKGARSVERTFWSPWDHVLPMKTDIADRAGGLRAVVRGCVQAWATRFDGILLGVSGGLDSSIVASCLGDISASVVTYTMITRDAQGDERAYASETCRHVGLPLETFPLELEDVDVGRSNAIHMPRPAGRLFAQAIDHILARLADGRERSASFSGNGGDHVFCFQQSAAPIVDRWKAEGLSLGVWKTIRDVMALTGCSVTEALAHAWWRSKTARLGYRWARDTSFLANPEAGASRLNHPWLNAPAGTLPGKAAHVAGLLRLQNYSEMKPADDGPVPVSPLLSQPIVEYCLTIPSWIWCSGGRNRAVARAAFAADLPDRIIDRRTKGGPDGFAAEIYEANLPRIREQLLGGLLREHGVIDGTAVEAALSADVMIRDFDFLRLLQLVDAEVWARLTLSRPVQAPMLASGAPAASA